MSEIVKTATEVENMTQINLITYAKELGNSFVELKNYLLDPETGVISQLQKELRTSQEINRSLLNQLSAVEKQSILNSQYTRRETVELHGVPASFDEGSGLEAKGINLMNEIAPEAKVEASDVQAIHRLRNKDRVIVKFISRKKKQSVLMKRSKLKDDATKSKHGIVGNIYLNESMWPQMKRLHYACKQMKRAQKLHYYTFFNGSLRVQVQESDGQKYVGHISDLVKLTGMERGDIEKLAPHRE